MSIGYSKDVERIDGVASRLMAVKIALQLTYREIADNTGVSPGSVERFMKGKINPGVTWVDRFCSYYHVDKEWLINGGTMPPMQCIVKGGVGERLKQMRSELGLKQKAVYEVLGIGTVMYSRIENGHGSLTMINAKKIEEAFGYGKDWILYGNESRKRYPVCDRLIEFLWKNEEERKKVWERMKK